MIRTVQSLLTPVILAGLCLHTLGCARPEPAAAPRPPAAVQTVAILPQWSGEDYEIVPRRFSASPASTATSGLNSPRGLRDGVYDRAASMHGVRTDGPAWINADLGEVLQVSRVLIACAAAKAPGGWGCDAVNSAVLEVSTDGATEDAPTRFNLGGEPVRHIRLSRSRGDLAVGDFRVFGPVELRRW